jgi:hypothetical protein
MVVGGPHVKWIPYFLARSAAFKVATGCGDKVNAAINWIACMQPAFNIVFLTAIPVGRAAKRIGLNASCSSCPLVAI